ncbi:nucleic acid-binding, OB-fold-like protein [Tanacetum coccineum]|uniref:Nucleic acid-binding, OB-fold-like protein n=1 Tax=Tanacetum coccineum TaxID=301880 RepID=A0ABQ5GQV5_9ASTR
MADMKLPKRKPVFTKVDNLRPTTSGHNLIVKVVSAKLVLQKGKHDDRQMRIAECLVGDKTGIILFTVRKNQGEKSSKMLNISFASRDLDEVAEIEMGTCCEY